MRKIRPSKIYSIVDNALKFIKYIRFRPYDTTTEEGRSNERMRRIALTALASSLAKVINTISILIYIPLTLSYLGLERYGIWMIFSSLALLFGFIDFGIGNGVLTLIADSSGKSDTQRQRIIITNSYISLATITIVTILAFISCFQFIPWGEIFNTKSDDLIEEIKLSALIYAILFLSGVPIGLINGIQSGLQQSFESSLWQCISSFMGLILIILTILFHGGLPYLVASIVSAPVTSNILNTIWFYKHRPNLIPKLHLYNIDAIFRIYRIGFMFFILQINVGLTFGFDNLIILHFAGQSQVSVYAISFQLFNMLGQIVILVISPTWPAFAEALARGERIWVRKALKRTIIFSFFIALVGSLALVLLMPALQIYWIRNEIYIPLALTIGLMLWRIVDTTGYSISMYLNAATILKEQIFISLITAISMLFMKIILVYNFGVSGMPYASALTYLVFTLIPYYFIVRRNVFSGT